MWNREIVKLLINKYQEHDILYNARNPNYMNRVKRSNALFQIWTELKEVNQDVTVALIKKKIHTLRTQFIKQSGQLDRSKRNGVGAEDVYEPTLWCFEQLQFLRQHCAIRKIESNISQTDEGSCDTVDEEEPAPQLYTLTHCNKRKKTMKLIEQMDNVKSLLRKRLCNQSNYDWLGEQVIFEMDSLTNEKIRRETAWKIQTLLREASLQDNATTAKSSYQERSSYTLDLGASNSCPLSPDFIDMIEIVKEEDF